MNARADIGLLLLEPINWLKTDVVGGYVGALKGWKFVVMNMTGGYTLTATKGTRVIEFQDELAHLAWTKAHDRIVKDESILLIQAGS